jgi:hypothetical protein
LEVQLSLKWFFLETGIPSDVSAKINVKLYQAFRKKHHLIMDDLLELIARGSGAFSPSLA